MVSNSPTKKSLPWDVVERKIREEMDWLRSVIQTFSEEEKGLGVPGIHYCRECLLRRIAILIISGQTKAIQINKTPPLKSFWINKKFNKKRPKIHHGGDWHRETMDKIESHFLSQGYEVVREPTLHWGRADLGIYKKGELNLMVEVGTISFFKLWYNLETMGHFIFLIVPDDDKLIEFRKIRFSSRTELFESTS